LCTESNGNERQSANADDLYRQHTETIVPVPNNEPALLNPIPQIQWLQWPMLLKLIVVGFLFTYNRNLSSYKVATVIGK
jgi:hypothetical protein